ncbi:MAG: putative toxin-antitoxin system toxin component, PIN family [Myxococcaceae bacterium]
MNRLIVLDTNVIVSAGIKAQSAPSQIVEQVLMGNLILVTCPDIVLEYLEVMTRPKFKQFGFPPFWLKTCIKMSHMTHENPNPTSDIFTDPKDAVFYHLAASFNAVLITGNLKHFPEDNPTGIRVLNPREYLELTRQNSKIAG